MGLVRVMLRVMMLVCVDHLPVVCLVGSDLVNLFLGDSFLPGDTRHCVGYIHGVFFLGLDRFSLMEFIYSSLRNVICAVLERSQRPQSLSDIHSLFFGPVAIAF